MAKPTKPAENANELDLEVSAKPTEKKVTVIFKEMIRASYGAYDEGQIAELDAKIAGTLIKAGIAAEFKESKAPAETIEEEK